MALPGGALRSYCILKQLRKSNDGYCYAKNQTLAAYYMGIQQCWVKQLLSILRREGWITVELTVSGEGSQRKFFRKIYVNSDNANTMREIVKTYDNKENSKQNEDFENDDNAD